MPNLSLNELKQIAKLRRIKNDKNMSKERLLGALDESEYNSIKRRENNFSDARIEKIRENFNKLRDRFLKLKIKEIRRNLYKIENKMNLSKTKIKEIDQNLTELRENIFKHNKYYDYDDLEYKGIRDIRNLFDEFDEDYYRPIKNTSAFNDNYMEYENNGDKNKNLSIKEYLYMIILYLSDMINDHKSPKILRLHSRYEVTYYETQYGEWKVQLTMAIKFIPSKDSKETRTIHIKSDSKEVMMNSKTDDIINGLFKSFLQKYQEELAESIRGTEFICDSVDLLRYHLKKSLKISGLHIDSSKLIKNKRVTINPKSKDNRCFKHSIVAVEHWEEIDNHPERISNLKDFFKGYNWNDIDFPRSSKDWKKFEQNKRIIGLNVLFVPYNTEKIELAYKSKHNQKRKNQATLLMITDGEKWH